MAGQVAVGVVVLAGAIAGIAGKTELALSDSLEIESVGVPL